MQHYVALFKGLQHNVAKMQQNSALFKKLQ